MAARDVEVKIIRSKSKETALGECGMKGALVDLRRLRRQRW